MIYKIMYRYRIVSGGITSIAGADTIYMNLNSRLSDSEKEKIVDQYAKQKYAKAYQTTENSVQTSNVRIYRTEGQPKDYASVLTKYNIPGQNKPSATFDKNKIISDCNKAIQDASTILRIVTDYKNNVEMRNAFNSSSSKGAERNQKLIAGTLVKLAKFN